MNINKTELTELIKSIIKEVLEETKPSKKKLSPKHYSNKAPFTQHSDKVEKLIGSIPFILLDKSIFVKNMDVVEFANKLDIKILRGEKKRLDEIVGIMIAEIKDFPAPRIEQLNEAISKLKLNSNKTTQRDKKSFFEEWDNVIKSL